MRSLRNFLLLAILLTGCGSELSPTNPSFSAPSPATSVRVAALSGGPAPAALLAIPLEQNPDPQVHQALLVDARRDSLEHPEIERFLAAGRTVYFHGLTLVQKTKVLRNYTPTHTNTNFSTLLLRRSQSSSSPQQLFLLEGEVTEQEVTRFLSAAALQTASSNPTLFTVAPNPKQLVVNYSGHFPTLAFNTTVLGTVPHGINQLADLVLNMKLTMLFQKAVSPGDSDRNLVVVESDATCSSFNPVEGANGLLTDEMGSFFKKGDVGWFLFGITDSARFDDIYLGGAYNSVISYSPNILTAEVDPLNVSTNLDLLVGPNSGSPDGHWHYNSQASMDLTDWQVNPTTFEWAQGLDIITYVYRSTKSYSSSLNVDGGLDLTGGGSGRGKEVLSPSPRSVQPFQWVNQTVHQLQTFAAETTYVRTINCYFGNAWYDHGMNYDTKALRTQVKIDLDFSKVQ